MRRHCWKLHYVNAVRVAEPAGVSVAAHELIEALKWVTDWAVNQKQCPVRQSALLSLGPDWSAPTPWRRCTRPSVPLYTGCPVSQWWMLLSAPLQNAWQHWVSARSHRDASLRRNTLFILKCLNLFMNTFKYGCKQIKRHLTSEVTKCLSHTVEK